jgi:hypothetical protein
MMCSSLDLTSSAFLSSCSAGLVAKQLGSAHAAFTPLLLQLVLCEAIALLALLHNSNDGHAEACARKPSQAEPTGSRVDEYNAQAKQQQTQGK